MAGAGAPSSSASFTPNGTLTQVAIGVSQGNSFRMESGYWHGPTVSEPPPPPPIPIGGLIVPVSKLGLLLPWIGLALLVVAAGAALLIWRRRANS